MINEVIISILEAETEADRLRQDGAAFAKSKAQETERRIAEIRRNGIEAAKAATAVILKEGDCKAAAAANDLSQKGEVEAHKILDAASFNKQEAVDYVVGRLLTQYGTR